MAKNKSPNKADKESAYKTFCDKECKRIPKLDEQYFFHHSSIDEYYGHSVAKDYFLSRKQPFSLFRTDKHYNLSFLDFLYENGYLLFREITRNGSCEYVFKIINVDTIVHVTFNVHSFEQEFIEVTFLYSHDSTGTFNAYNEFLFEKTKCARLGVFKRSYQELVVHDLLLKDVKPFDPLNYNEDFEPFAYNVVSELEKKDSGLFLFYGDPGTGKSSFIRNLTGMVDRQFIFVPPHLFKDVFSLDMIDMFLDRNKASVLVIEDAEKLLLKRESEDGYSNSETISAILNVTDGLYADLTKVAIIATYNCDRNKIDPAILRKGRLKYEYEFKKLKRERVQALIEKYKLDIECDEDMSLADIYNFDKESSIQKEEKRQIGFSA
jgi:hypothetical protein